MASAERHRRLHPVMLKLSRKSVGRRNANSTEAVLSFASKHGQLPGMVSPNEMSLRLLAGKRILVFEDGFLLSDEAESRLVDAGAVILGPVSTAQQAIDHLQNGGVDAVVLDVALEPETVLPIIVELEEKSIPFIFALAANPRLDTKRFTGFVLSDRDRDLSTIAEALFRRRSMEH